MPPDTTSPIGVFDSGVGGLTVLRALVRRLPSESTVYLGDTARVPYGTKSADVVTRYSIANAEFLRERGIKVLVVACNTAASVGLPALSGRLDLPVIGVIDPGAQAAAQVSRSGRIGVIGTPGTIRSGAYQRALALARPGAHVVARACPLFVPLAEEGWVEGEVPSLAAKAYLEDLARERIDTLVLGCTHYPLLREVIQRAVGPEVTLVDSAEAAAEAVFRRLREEGLLAGSEADARRDFYVTDVPERFLDVASRFLGEPVPSAEQVDVRPA